VRARITLCVCVLATGLGACGDDDSERLRDTRVYNVSGTQEQLDAMVAAAEGG
jgi:hypothetical protein